MTGEKAYQNAIRRRAELRHELDEIETFLRLYARYAGGEVREIAESATPAQGRAPELSDTVPTKARSRNKRTNDLEPQIESLIRDRGKPMKRGAIARALAEDGTPIAAKNPSGYVGVVMWRAKKRFINLAGHGYWPRDVAYPPAGYDPAQAQNAETNEEEAKENGAAAAGGGSNADLWAASSSEISSATARARGE